MVKSNLEYHFPLSLIFENHDLSRDERLTFFQPYMVQGVCINDCLRIHGSLLYDYMSVCEP